ncbi:MAG: orotate phosphoribosyltransferase [Thermoplasmata archaeon]
MNLKDMLERCGAVKYGDFTLTSGKKSKYYVDIKLASTQPDILMKISEMMAEHMDKDARRIAGMELGAVPIATALSLKTGIPYVMMRKKKKGHGTGGRIEGEIKKGEKVVIVEDVTTTGGSSVETVKVLRDFGAVVDKVLVVVDRQEGGKEALDEIGVELIPLLTADDILSQS